METGRSRARAARGGRERGDPWPRARSLSGQPVFARGSRSSLSEATLWLENVPADLVLIVLRTLAVHHLRGRGEGLSRPLGARVGHLSA